MAKQLRALIIEDSEDDALLIIRELKQGGYVPEWERVRTASTLRAELKKEWDIILADYQMPRFTGLEALKIVKQRGPDIPFIVISGTIGEETAVKAMKAGAHDYIMKENLKRLVPAIEREIREARLRAKKREVQEILDESEEKYRLLFNTAPSGILHVNTKGTVLTCNRAFLRLTGFKKEDIVGIHFTKLPTLPKKQMADYTKLFEDIISGKRLNNIAFKWVHFDGSMKWGECTASLVKKDGKITGAQVILTDITKRKQTEEAFKESEARLSSFMDSATDSFYLLDSQMNFLEMNKKALGIIGKKKEEVIGKNIVDIVPDIKESGRYDKHLEVMRTGESYIIEDFIPHPVFGDRHFILKSFKVGNGLGVIASDITDRKQAEKALQQSEARFRELAEMLPEIVFETDRELNLTFANKRAFAMFEYDIEDMERGLNGLQMLVPKDRDHAKANLTMRLQGKNPGTVEYTAMKKDGTTFPILFHASPIITNGEIIGFRGIIFDITDRKRVEEAIKESEAKFRTITESSPDAIFITDQKGYYTYANSAASALLGYSVDELLRKNIKELSVETQIEENLKVFQTVLQEKHLYTEIEMVKKDGTVLPVDLNAVLLPNGFVYGSCRDLTERKKVEEALKKSEARFSTIFHANPAAIAITRISDNRLVNVNQAFLEVTGYEREEVIDHTPKNLHLWSDPAEREEATKTLRKKGKLRGEFSIRRKTGEIRDLLFSAELIELSGERYMLSMGQDISGRKQAESKVRQSLKEKEILLREVHHRVKNNLQIIVSLLNLQAKKIMNEEALNQCNEAKRRIYSMALVHEKLYQSEDLASIEFGNYIRTISSELTREMESITLEQDLDKVYLGIDIAIPCGLIINELITNAVKHAFPDGRGTISIMLKVEKNEYRLTVRDDGIGLSIDIDVAATDSLGLQLVNILTEQIDGRLEVEREGGTAFTITFNI